MQSKGRVRGAPELASSHTGHWKQPSGSASARGPSLASNTLPSRSCGCATILPPGSTGQRQRRWGGEREAEGEEEEEPEGAGRGPITSEIGEFQYKKKTKLSSFHVVNSSISTISEEGMFWEKNRSFRDSEFELTAVLSSDFK